MDNDKIKNYSVKDIRFPTSLTLDGSDAVHKDPDYSCVYVEIISQNGREGVGITFTIGRGQELVVSASKMLLEKIIGKRLKEIFEDFPKTWRSFTNDSQERWIGPEKGVIHLATAAVTNALWDMWAKLSGKPLWKFLVDLDPEDLVRTIDFTHIRDAITEQEAIELLKKSSIGKTERENEILQNGYPAYVTAAGWLGYPDDKIKRLCKEFMDKGFNAFKVKVGVEIEDDKRRCEVFRSIIGEKNLLMVDANQKWEVDEAIEWMKQLSHVRPHFIEEPTNPDDILGHGTISTALNPLGIGVATGEMCQNRVMFKQFLQSSSINYCQIDACRLGGVPEVLSVYLMAKKFNVPVWPHAGGVGLCEQVQHLQMWDYISLSGTMENRYIEYVNHLREYMKHPCTIRNACYLAPQTAGYNVEIKENAIAEFEYPSGSKWQELFKEGKY